MPRRRQPRELWHLTRLRVLEAYNYRCARCGCVLTVSTAHIDHIQSGKLGSNHFSNLRPLCRRDHVLRLDPRHRGMIARALQLGIIPANWRELVWE